MKDFCLNARWEHWHPSKPVWSIVWIPTHTSRAMLTTHQYQRNSIPVCNVPIYSFDIFDENLWFAVWKKWEKSIEIEKLLQYHSYIALSIWLCFWLWWCSFLSENRISLYLMLLLLRTTLPTFTRKDQKAVKCVEVRCPPFIEWIWDRLIEYTVDFRFKQPIVDFGKN